MVLGIVGLVIAPIICSIPAVVFGYKAKNEISRDPSVQGGGQATAGIVLGWVGIAYGLFLLALFVIFIVSMLAGGYAVSEWHTHISDAGDWSFTTTTT
jgi:hypothetical protein